MVKLNSCLHAISWKLNTLPLRLPPVDLRQQIEQALPPNRYRLLRISRIYQQVADSSTHISKIDLAPPTPESLFGNLWEKMGYDPDDSVKRDFLQLLHEAQQDIDVQQP